MRRLEGVLGLGSVGCCGPGEAPDIKARNPSVKEKSC